MSMPQKLRVLKTCSYLVLKNNIQQIKIRLQNYLDILSYFFMHISYYLYYFHTSFRQA